MRKGRSREYEAARQLNPDLLLATYNLGVLEAKKDPDAAIQLWRETLGKDSDFVPSRMMLADVYLKQRKFAESAAEYEAVLRLQPESDAKDRLPEVLGDLNTAAGKTVEACSQYRLVKGVAPEHKRALARKMSRVCK